MFRLTNIFGILITMGSIGLLAQPITSIADLLYLLSSLIGIPLGIWIFLSARTFGATVEKQEKKTKTAP
jgi:hypothetical protein